MDGKGLRMQAYYYSFDRTGIAPVDKVLSAVACAGKAFHHTDCWTDDDTHPDHDGGSPRDWIQNAANAVAAQLAFANAENARLREALAIERKWAHENCTAENCTASGVDCPGAPGGAA